MITRSVNLQGGVQLPTGGKRRDGTSTTSPPCLKPATRTPTHAAGRWIRCDTEADSDSLDGRRAL